ncbi:MAG: glycosyltransferase family 39 protein [Deltaproteobacteria bacterium]|nr:glycosyltransferase family 39 protein [Deltaproteobacteria bacterium]
MKILSHSRTSSQDYTPYVLVFLVSMGARAFFLVWIDEPILFFKYPYFAEKLAAGGDIGERIVDLSPFYLYFLTFLKKIFGIDWATVKLIQSFVGASNALLILAVGNRLFHNNTGLYAALLYALYGNVIILETTLEPTVFIIFLNLLLIYFLLHATDGGASPSQSTALILTGGAFTGLSIITKPNALLFIPVGIVWLLFFATRNHPLRERLLQSALFCGAALMAVSPVTFRNYHKLHDFVLVTADAGKVFYHGNSRGATALEGADLPDDGSGDQGYGEPDYAHVVFRKTAAMLTGHAICPSEASWFWIKRTLDDIWGDPGGYLIREIKKFIFFFTDYEMHYIASAYKEYKASLSFPFIRYGMIMSLGVLGMLLCIKDFRELFLIYGAVGVYLFAGMLFLVQSRYRTPAVPFFCLFAGCTINSLIQMISARKVISFCMLLLSAGVLFVLSHAAFMGEILRQDRWQEATKICFELRARPLFDRGRYQAAITHLDGCLNLVPDFRPALNLRGKARAILGQYKMAETDFKRLIALSPGSAQGYRNIGFVYLLQEDRKKAEIFLTKALSLAPHDKKVESALKKIRSASP